MSCSNFTFNANRVKSDITFRQLIGAEFCASLSEEMISLANSASHPVASPVLHCTPSEIPIGSTSGSSVKKRNAQDAVIANFRKEILEDLSAHYGSSALRRGGSKVIGTSYRHPGLLRRGHHRKEQIVWNIQKAHRFLCRHCGVWLRSGITKGTVSIDVSNERENVDGSVEKEQEVPNEVKSTSSDKLSRKGLATLCLRCLRLRAHDGVRSQSRRFVQNGVDTNKVREQVLGLEQLLQCQVKRSRRKRKAKKSQNKEMKDALPTALVLLSPAEDVLQKQIKQSFQAIPKGPLRRKNVIHSPAPSKKEEGNRTKEVHPPPSSGTAKVVPSSPLSKVPHQHPSLSSQGSSILSKGKNSCGSTSSAGGNEMKSGGVLEKPIPRGFPLIKLNRKRTSKHGSQPPKERTAHDDLLANLGL